MFAPSGGLARRSLTYIASLLQRYERISLCSSCCNSQPAFFAWLKSDIIDRKGQVDEAQFTVNSNEVIVTGQFRNSRGYRAAANFRLVVENGRIISWQMRY